MRRLACLMTLALAGFVQCVPAPPPDPEAFDAGEPQDAGSLDSGTVNACEPWSGSTPGRDGGCAGFPQAIDDAGAAETFQLLPHAVAEVRNVTYAVRDGWVLQGDLYVPAQPDGGSAPGVLVVVHGGGWEACDSRRASVTEFAYVMAALGRFATFNVEYRLVNEGGAFPVNLQDVKCAVQWVAESAPARFPVDGARVAIAGSSAGAHLALMTGLTEHREDLDPGCGSAPPEVLAVVSYSAPTDLPTLASGQGWAKSAVAKNAGPCETPVASCEEGRACDRCVDASPLAHACHASDPYLLVQAPDPWDLIIPFEQADRLTAALQEAGADVTLLSPSAEVLADGGCAPEPNVFAHGFMPCLTRPTGGAVLDLLVPLLTQ